MKNIYILFVISLLVLSCKRYQAEQKEYPIITIPLSSPIVSEDFFDYELIPLETNDNCLIGVVNSIKMYEDKLYILDAYRANALYVFDLNGVFIKQIGKSGGGNGEYSFAAVFKIKEDERKIIIGDREGSRLLFYDLDSYEFVKSLRVPFYFYDFEILPSGNYLWYSHQSFTQNKEKYYLLETDEQFEPVASCFEAIFKSGYTASIGSDILYKWDNRYFTFHYLDPIIYEIGEKGKLTPYIELAFENHSQAPLDYMKELSTATTNFSYTLAKSEYISTFWIYEMKDLICIYYVRDSNFYVALYDKTKDKVYNYSLYEFNKLFNLDTVISPKGQTENQIIGSISPVGLMKESNNMNEKVQAIKHKLDEEGNPVVILFNLKEES